MEMESRVDPRMQFVLVGDDVFIRRSNRKTFQKAEVVSITPKHGFVNVEWRDNDGNLWGREVTIGDVIELNPHLIVRSPLEMVNASKSAIVSYQENNPDIPEKMKNDERRAVKSSNPEASVDNKDWLADVQARLTDARIRGTTLPKNPFIPDRYFRNSESENGDEEDQSVGSDGMHDEKRKSTMQIFGEASQFFKNMLSRGTHDEINRTPNLEAYGTASEGDGSQEKLSIYYEDIHSAETHANNSSSSTQFVSFQPRTREDPFYSPLMEEMYAPHAIHVKPKHTTETVPQKRCANFNSRRNSNEVHSFPLENKYSPSSKNKNVTKCKKNSLKPGTTPVNSLPPKRKNESSHSYTRPSSTNPFTSHVNNIQRPPTTESNRGSKTHNSHHVVTQSTSGSRQKPSVVETIQRLERDREQRRRNQEVKRAEENALRMKDPGNVNWKFALMVNEYRQQILCDPLKLSDPVKHARIIVCIRKRPLNAKEIEAKEIDVITIPNKDLVLVHEPKTKLDMTKYLENHAFRFDYAFDENSTNEMVYQFTTKPLIDTIFEGGMATVFAYGQTGSGKTHTMGGNFNGTKQDSNNGIYMNVANDIIHMLSLSEYEELGLRLSVTFFEIYKGRLYDLLAGRNEIKVMEDVDQQIQIVGLTELYANGLDEIVSLIRRGNASRTSGKTAINPMSSRSHSVFQLILRQDPGENNKGQIYGKFSLIDLAGNERGVGRGLVIDRQLEIEGAEINKSLLALKECIRALARNEGHIPFRGSKLTLVLKDTFMNTNSRVCMIGTVSPGHSSCNCSLNTILYANRVKEFNAHDPLNDDMGNSVKQ